MTGMDFGRIFHTLTDHEPLHWQSRLHARFMAGNLPPALDLPTGLGKTSVMAVWLAATIMGAPLPKRLVYVVDRRTVVDQATDEADKLKARAEAAGLLADLPISTLRGQHLDNRRWMEDPAAPAIIIGTIDMIGSRLLFQGYGVSTGLRPFQAGLIGADTLLVLDEAHLCPPFQALLEQVEKGDGWKPVGTETGLVPPFRLMSLSATGKHADNAFTLEAEDQGDEFVRERLTAAKHLTILPATGKLDEQLVRQARDLADGLGGRIAIFCNSREMAQKVVEELKDKKAKRPDGSVVLLAGARRVKEREQARTELVVAGFLPANEDNDMAPLPDPTFLVATAAGEVGIDLDADHAVMDLVSAERMIQRLGRVNRKGGADRVAQVRVIDAAPDKEPIEATAWRDACRQLLESLPATADGVFDASPGALRTLRSHPLLPTASTPAPLHPALDRPTLDAWAMTSLRDHPGRPDIAPWLRGWVKEDDPEVTLVWRRWPWDGEKHRLPDDKALAVFFEKARPRLLEQVQAPGSLALKVLADRAKKIDWAYDTVVVLALGDSIGKLRLDGLRDKKQRDRFFERATGTIFVVHHGLGGLDAQGLLSSDAEGPSACLDGGWEEEDLRIAGLRIVEEKPEEPATAFNWLAVDRFALIDPSHPDTERFLAIETWRDGNQESGGDPAIRRREQALAAHLGEAAAEAGLLADRLRLPPPYCAMLVAAAATHDLGKARPRWQQAMGAPRGKEPLAKTTGRGANPALLKINGEIYRHEFGSLLDLERNPEPLAGLPDDLRELALHLVASHHGHARPWIAPVDPDPRTSLHSHRERAAQAALRFARLQARWGPWGLAWWEALLRAADQRVSRRLDQEGA